MKTEGDVMAMVRYNILKNRTDDALYFDAETELNKSEEKNDRR